MDNAFGICLFQWSAPYKYDTTAEYTRWWRLLFRPCRFGKSFFDFPFRYDGTNCGWLCLHFGTLSLRYWNVIYFPGVQTNAYAGNPSNAVMWVISEPTSHTNQPHLTFVSYSPCDSDFELILQFAGKNFTLAKEDILVPSYLAIDSLDLGGSTSQQCQFQAQPDDPTEDEFGPFTSITYQFGDPLLRNVAMVRDSFRWICVETNLLICMLQLGLRLRQCSRLHHIITSNGLCTTMSGSYPSQSQRGSWTMCWNNIMTRCILHFTVQK